MRKKPVKTRNFGLVKDTFDIRDRIYVRRLKADVYPESTERRNFINFPFRWDQDGIGSCTGHGGAAGFVQALIRNNQSVFEPSRIFPYYNARPEDSKNEDCGASIRDLIKAIAKYGLCKETTWPSDPNKFAVKPSQKAYIEGEQHQAIEYYRIYPITKEAIMDAIHNGFALIYGQILYESFMSDKVAKTGNVPYPNTCWEDVVGGHCKLGMDYEPGGVFDLNSWGRNWGSDGGCLIPWKYILNPKLTFDMWVIKLTE
ncbi:MAG: C1 family peptidase [Spirochaetota bacterium]|nr:C1 family peptidase [Spirochaetota bacterium]